MKIKVSYVQARRFIDFHTLILNSYYNLKIADMLFKHDESDICAVDIFFDAAGSPVEKGLTGNLDQRLGADEAVFKKPAAPASHGENEMEFRHSLDSFVLRIFAKLHGASRTPPPTRKIKKL